MTSLQIRLMDGYVTTHAAIAGKNVRDLEQALGFLPGALTKGYRVYELISPVTMDEFEWKDRTRYSGGWHYDPPSNEYIQRHDQLRFHLAKSNGWNEAAADAQLKRFMEEHCVRLNVRTGPERIVKVDPLVKVQQGFDSYPDSPYLDIPQWRLKVAKTFSLIASSVTSR